MILILVITVITTGDKIMGIQLFFQSQNPVQYPSNASAQPSKDQGELIISKSL